MRYYGDTSTGTISFKFGKVYTVSYDANGGTGAPSTQNKDYGKSITLSNIVPTRTGYTFQGWSTSSSATTASYQPGATFSIDSNTTLYAVWKVNTYTVKYNANGGSGTMSDSSHTYDVSKSLTTNAFTKPGCTFIGWSTSSSVTTATYTDGQSVKNLTPINGSTVNLYAVWQDSTAVLSVDSTNSAVISTGNTMKYFSFTPSTSGKYVIYSTGSADTKVYLYNSSGSQITYNDNGGEGNNFRLEYSMTAGTRYILGVRYCSSSSTGTISFKFGKVYTVSYNANGGSGAPSSQNKDYGKSITLSSTAPTYTGRVFWGWSTSSTATTASYQPGCTFSADGDTVLYAVWHSHSYTSRVTTAETCTTAGVRTYTCTGCSHSYTEKIPVKSHSWVNATCTAPKTCSACGEKSGNSLGHDYSPEAIREETCTTSGTEMYCCSRCDSNYTVIIPAKGHNWQSATCTTAKRCLNCATTEGAKLGHDMGREEVVPEKCKVDGKKTTFCCRSGCNYKEEEILYALPDHVYGATQEKAATCTEVGWIMSSCTISGCNNSTSYAIPALGHNYSSRITKEPTCTTAGVKTFTCSRCDHTYTEEIENVAHVYSSDYTVDVVASCLSEGEKSRHCTASGCDSRTDIIKTDKLSHSFRKTTTKATLTTDGKIESKCSVCGDVQDSLTVTKIGSVTLSVTKYVHDGKNKTPKVTVKDADGKVLTKNVDYKTSVASKRSGIGRYTVKVTFIGNYSGSKSVYFYILPGKTAKVSAVAQTSESVELSWSKVSGAAGYTVYRYSASKKAYVKAGTTEGTSFTVKKLNAATKYTFKVVAYGKTSSGKVYDSESYTLLKTATQTKTPSITVSSTASKKATVKWNNVSGEGGYQVWYSTSKNGTYTRFGNAKADVTSLTVTGLTKGKTYYFKIRTFIKTDSGYVYGAYSNVKSVKVK